MNGQCDNSSCLSLLCSSATCQCPSTGSRRNSSLTQPCRGCDTEWGKAAFSEKRCSRRLKPAKVGTWA